MSTRPHPDVAEYIERVTDTFEPFVGVSAAPGIPLGRPGESDDIALLLGAEASDVTGAAGIRAAGGL